MAVDLDAAQSIRNGTNDQLFAAALDTVGAVVLVVAPDGCIAYVNRTCAEASLRPAEEMTGRNIAEFLATEEFESIETLLREVLDGRPVRGMEAHWVAKYGIRRLVDWTICPIAIEGGRREYVVFTGIDITEQRRAQDMIRDDAEEIQSVLANSISAFALTVEARDPYTAGHQNRVAQLAAAIAVELGFADEIVEGIRMGAMIHDIGKIYVPSEILNRPGRLSHQEFDIITTHPRVGFDIVKGLAFPWPIAKMIHQHHERMDGSGYPQGLKGDEIAVEARIIAVADVVEAVASHRPYRPSLGIEKGLAVLAEGRGTHFWTEATDACLRLFKEKRFTWHAA